MRNKTLIPALLSAVVLPLLSACDAVNSGLASLRTDVPQREPDARRMSLLQERMGSTGDATSGADTSSGEPPGETEAGTTSDNMPLEDTDGAGTTSPGGSSSGGESSTGDDTTTSGTTGDLEKNCPWWGCEMPPGWVQQVPGTYLDEVAGDCGYPIGHPEIGDAKCAAHAEARGAAHIPHDCIRASDGVPAAVFGGWWFPVPEGVEPALCTPQCPYGGYTDSCGDLSFAVYDGVSTMSCGSLSPDPDAQGHCHPYATDWYGYPLNLYVGGYVMVEEYFTFYPGWGG